MNRYLFALVLLAGCSTPTLQPVASAHVHKAPHGGALVEVGEESAHCELVWDAARGYLTLYVLDGECELPVRISQKKLLVQCSGSTYPLKAVRSALTEETVGNSSQFEGELAPLRGRTSWQGQLVRLEIQGRVFQNLALEVARP